MSETGGLPEVAAVVTLSAPLYNAAVEGLREAVTAGLEELLRSLGLPGRPEVQISQAADASSPFPVALAVHGRKCRYSMELLQRVESYLTGEPVSPMFTVEKLTNWLTVPDGRHLPGGVCHADLRGSVQSAGIGFALIGTGGGLRGEPAGVHGAGRKLAGGGTGEGAGPAVSVDGPHHGGECSGTVRGTGAHGGRRG